jgi:DNA integrity scanning protein DisA with diadenylate cyclase activity
MKKTSYFLISFAMLVSACVEEVVPKPEKLISKEQMIDILYDVSVLVAAKNTNKAVLLQNGIDPMEYIYEKYGIDSLQYVQSDAYYASKPNEYLDIYTKVESRLADKKQELQDARMESSEAATERAKIEVQEAMEQKRQDSVADTPLEN